MMTLSTSKVSKKGLTNIPVSIRREAGIEEGDTIIWHVREDGVIEVRVVKNPYRLLKGKYKDPNLTYDKVEGIADKILEEGTNANNRA